MKYLSVAVPSYNVEKYLNKCLDSFADERLKDLEVLIVNDGSSDRTEEIARSYVEKYPDIFRLINKENGGHGSAVNAGLDQAVGKYFRIVDGDDWVHTENMVKWLERAKTIEADMIVDQKTTVNMVTGETEYFPLPAGTPFDKEVPFEDFSTIEHCEYYMLHTVSIRTDFLKKYQIHLLQHTFYVDFEFILKSTSRVKNIMFLDLDIYRYLIGNTNQSVDSQNYVKRLDHHRRVVEECLKFGAQKDYPENRQEYVKIRQGLLIHTHDKISLIYNHDRKEGSRYAKNFRKWLKDNYPEIHERTKKRYRILKVLHALGVNETSSEKIKKVLGR